MKELGAFLIINLCMGGSAYAQSLRYEELPALVQSKNKKVAAEKHELQAQEVRTGYLGRSFLPELQLSAGTEVFKIGNAAQDFGNDWKVEMSLNIYRGGQDFFEDKIRASDFKVQKEVLEEKSRMELLQARKLYWQAVTTKRFIKTHEEALETNNKNLKTASQRVRSGVAPKSDPLEFELRATLLIQELKKLRIEYDSFLNKLAVLIGNETHEQLQLTDDLPHPPENEKEASRIDVAQHPSVLQLERKSLGYSLEAKKHQRNTWPQLDVVANYGALSPRERPELSEEPREEWSLGFRARMNLFDRNESRQNAASLAARETAHRLYADLKKKELEADLHETQKELALWHELLHDAEQSYEKSKEFLRSTLSEYSRGVKNGPDVLDAFDKSLDFEKRQYQLLNEYYQSKAELLYLEGK